MNNRRYLSRWLLMASIVTAMAMILLANPIQPQARPMTTGTAVVTPTKAAVLSEDAQALTGNIVYVSNRSGSYEIYITSPDGSDTRALTTSDDTMVVKWWPSISPDGTHIAFVANTKENELAYDVYTMDIDGSHIKRVTDLGMKIFCVEWSPDATKFALCGRPSDDSGEQEIYTMNVDGTELVNLTDNAVLDYDPEWSPDGNHIAFDSDRDKTENEIGHIFIMKADGSEVRQLVSGYSAAWSPDGSKIAYVGECASSSRRVGTVCVMNADGTDQQPVPSSFGVDVAPHWSPDGKFLVVASRPVTPEGADNEIYVIALDSIERIRLTDNEADDGLVNWGVAP